MCSMLGGVDWTREFSFILVVVFRCNRRANRGSCVATASLPEGRSHYITFLQRKTLIPPSWYYLRLAGGRGWVGLEGGVYQINELADCIQKKLLKYGGNGAALLPFFEN